MDGINNFKEISGIVYICHSQLKLLFIFLKLSPAAALNVKLSAGFKA